MHDLGCLLPVLYMLQMQYGCFLNKILSPMLAIPHAAFAIAFILLLSPSGWLLKIIGQFVGWVIPPNIVTVNDS